MHWSSAVLFEPDGDRLRCTLCPTGCSLKDGQVGACKVRRRAGNVGETATFATSVRHIDAVERKPFYHYRPGSKALTIAAPGCTFRCDYCVNFRLSQFGRDDQVPWTGQAVDPVELVRSAAEFGGCVAMSYSEPSLAIELTLAVHRMGKPAGVDVVWKSNGYLTAEAIRLVAPALTAVNIDVKGMDDVTHRQLTGASSTPVLDAVRLFHQLGVWVEICTPLIPGVSADPGDLTRIGDFIAGIDPGIPWHILRFTPTYRRAGDEPTSPDALAQARAIGLAAGLRYVYVERALGAEGRTTYCYGCDAVLVARDVWTDVRSIISEAMCPQCGTGIEGRW